MRKVNWQPIRQVGQYAQATVRRVQARVLARSEQTRAVRRDLRRADWLPIASRYGTHALIILIVLAVVLAGLGLPDWAVEGWPGQPLAQAVEKPGEPGGVALQGSPGGEPTFMVPLALPNTIVPKRGRRGIITYVVQPGDWIESIAKKFEISIDTLIWSNPKLEENPDLLSIGQEIVVLPVDGVYHTVKQGDTIAAIAKQYSADPQAIWNCPFNDPQALEDLTPGQKIIVPAGKKPYVPRAVYVYTGSVPKDAKRGTGVFGWPTTGVITQGYWVTPGGSGHRAIDIANPSQPFIRAADSGFVVKVEHNSGNTGYGNHVIIDHRNGFMTLYGHLDTILVNVGDSVGKGGIIGRMGNTGKVRGITGIHLHFEIWKNGIAVNPMVYLQ